MSITLSYTYYDNFEQLKYLTNLYKNTDYKFIVVDDASPKRPLDANDVPDNWSLYRVTKDVGWNCEGCRNLIAKVCDTKWIAFFNMDYELIDDIDLNDHEEDCIYFFDDYKNNSPTRLPPKNFYHDQIYTTKEYFWKCGGYDETHIGYYGLDGLLVRANFRYNISEFRIKSIKSIDKNYEIEQAERKYTLGRENPNIVLPDLPKSNDKIRFPWMKIK